MQQCGGLPGVNIGGYLTNLDDKRRLYFRLFGHALLRHATKPTDAASAPLDGPVVHVDRLASLEVRRAPSAMPAFAAIFALRTSDGARLRLACECSRQTRYWISAIRRTGATVSGASLFLSSTALPSARRRTTSPSASSSQQRVASSSSPPPPPSSSSSSTTTSSSRTLRKKKRRGAGASSSSRAAAPVSSSTSSVPAVYAPFALTLVATTAASLAAPYALLLACLLLGTQVLVAAMLRVISVDALSVALLVAGALAVATLTLFVARLVLERRAFRRRSGYVSLINYAAPASLAAQLKHAALHAVFIVALVFLAIAFDAARAYADAHAASLPSHTPLGALLLLSLALVLFIFVAALVARFFCAPFEKTRTAAADAMDDEEDEEEERGNGDDEDDELVKLEEGDAEIEREMSPLIDLEDD